MDSVQICNLALMMVGIPPITSFEDENNNAKQCKKFFPVLRDRVLRDHIWSFACSSYDLQVLDEESPDPEYRFVCTLPGDLIRVLNVVGDFPYRLFGGKLLIDLHPARIHYIRRIEDPSLFDETFVEALQYLLAAEIGMANTRDPNLISFYRQEYERRLAVARSIDSSENRFDAQNSPRRSRWIESRFGSGTGIPHNRIGGTVFTEGTEGRQEGY